MQTVVANIGADKILDEADNICDRCFAKADQQLKDGITKAMAKHV